MNSDCDRNLLQVAIRQKERIGRANIPVLSLSCYSRDSEIAPTGSFLLTRRSAGAGNRTLRSLLQETNSEKLVRRELTIALAIHSLDLLQEDNIERLVRREFTIALAIHSLDCTLRNLVRGL